MLLPPNRRRSLSDSKVVAAYWVGTTTGALLSALSVWILSGFTEPLGTWGRIVLLLAGALLVWLARHGPLVGVITLPEARRQIPSQVFTNGIYRGAYQFGFEMGTGVRTYVPSIAPYFLLLSVWLAHPTLATALLVGFGFGLGRAIPMMAMLARRTPQVMTQDSGLAAEFLRGKDIYATPLTGLLVLLGAIVLVY